jgi:hypothetical protein
MNDILCGYTGDRESALMAYLYDEITPDDRNEFESHLATCARCRAELNSLRGVRRDLARWSPPSFAGIHQLAADQPAADTPPASTGRWWRDMPAWAQVAAAMVILGVSAGVANLNVHYDAQSGLNIRTGWSSSPRAVAPVSASLSDRQDASWRTELTALEGQLRAEIRDLHAVPAGTPAAVRTATSNDPETLRQVRMLIEQSERRQQSELALRVAALSNEINMQRQTDLRRIDQNLGIFQDRTGVEVLRNRQKLDYLLQRVSQQP